MYEYVPLEGGSGTKPAAVTTTKKKKKSTASVITPVAAISPGVAAEPDSQFIPHDAYDPSGDARYQDALSALQQISDGAPVYDPVYEPMLKGLFSQLEQKDPFSYDLQTDPLYRQYRQQYVMQGQLAAEDAAARTAALTGGYGSTYSQQAGQQAYEGYLRELNALVPELFAAARQSYDADLDALYRRIQLTGNLADREYGAYRDAYARWQDQQQQAMDAAETAYQQGHQQWKDRSTLRQQAYTQLSELIAKSGYLPSDQQLEEAGMTRAQADALRQLYLRGGKA